MFFDTTAYVGAKVTALPQIVNQMPLKIDVHKDQQFGDFIHWSMSGLVEGFEHNRGRKVISPKTFKSVREKFNPLGIITRIGCLTHDGTKVTLADGHSSSMGMYYRYWDGKMPKEELEHPFTLYIYPETDLQNLYDTLNNTDPHKSKDRVDNPDFAYGYLLHRELAPLLKNPTIDFLGLDRSVDNKAFLTSLSEILYGVYHGKPKLNNGNSGWRSTTVYALRGKSRAWQTQPAGSLPIKNEKLVQLATALDSYVDLTQEVKIGAGKMNTNGLMKSKQFFFLTVVEKLGTNSLIPKRNKTLASNILKNYSKIDALSRIITHGPFEVQEGHYNNMVRLLNGKSK
jgi:hypothetical protein